MKYVFVLLLLLLSACSYNIEFFQEPFIPEINTSLPEQNPTYIPSNQHLQENETFLSKEFFFEHQDNLFSFNLSLSNQTYLAHQPLSRTYSYRGSLPDDWLTEYYSMFIFEGFDDELIDSIIQTIKQSDPDMTDVQLVRAVTSFVQYIPYDWSKVFDVFDSVNYPYETLMRQSGVCSDTTVLLARLLIELDYSVSLFTYEEANHIAVGIACPRGVDNYNSGFCFIETTAPNMIGHIPSSFGVAGEITLDETPEIVPIHQGRTYAGAQEDFLRRQELTQRYGSSILEMSREKRELYKQITHLQEELDALGCEGVLPRNLYEECNTIITTVNYFINEFNTLVDESRNS